jgi:hypothetical protein
MTAPPRLSAGSSLRVGESFVTFPTPDKGHDAGIIRDGGREEDADFLAISSARTGGVTAETVSSGTTHAPPVDEVRAYREFRRMALRLTGVDTLPTNPGGDPRDKAVTTRVHVRPRTADARSETHSSDFSP